MLNKKISSLGSSLKAFGYALRSLSAAVFAAFFRRLSLFNRRGSYKQRGSLVRRFQILLLSWGVLVYLIAVVGFWVVSSSALQYTFKQQAAHWVSRIDEMSAPLFMARGSEDLSAIQAYVDGIEAITYVSFFKGDGEQSIGSYVTSKSLQGKAPEFSPELIESYSLLELGESFSYSSSFNANQYLMRVVTPVSIISMNADDMLDFQFDEKQQETVKIIGYMDVGFDFSEYQRELVASIIQASVVILVIFIVAAIVGRNLTKRALKPLLDLREPLDRLARGDTDVWVDRNGDEEIVAISNALNSTIRAIKGRDKELRRLADFDALTGLFNKRSFDLVLQEEWQRVRDENDCSALFCIDLDQFKYVNDTVGHAAGDRLLVQVAELFSKRMRYDDVVCRLGGDEFAVLARSVSKADATELARSIVKSMQDFLFIDQGKTFNIYCSVGVVLIENDNYSAEEVFSNADMACYMAKSEGRNRYNFFEAMAISKNKDDIGWTRKIADALSADNFVLHYQPIVSLATEAMRSYEVLLRMNDSDGQLVSPNMFIPVAERFGLATEIDYWVIEASMKKLEMLNKEGEKIRFYVNLSGQLFLDDDFVDRVKAIFESVDISADQVVFELTERTAVGNLREASKKMESLQELGFQFAVDDFGSGFSSYSYLKHMPVEYVKIEGEFVERIVDDEVDRAMVKSMVDIAKACGKKVVAEYVCDQKTLDILRGYGIDYVQGFFIAKPEANPTAVSALPVANTENIGKVTPINING